ncbi:MAG: RtcB family protein [Phycisphaeraceae bacterium]|nr:RtcB family protein [Phycisphaeraceae bacterium]
MAAEARSPAPHRVWGEVGVDLDKPSLDQLVAACSLPVAVAGALMPDAHVGYGLPIGGVLATRGAVVPYAVGVDIACRVKLSVLDMPAASLDSEHGRGQLGKAIERETRFGVGAAFQKPREHPVMDERWDVSPVTEHYKDKARSQLGTSGSGNHFVEFGTLTIDEGASALGLAAGTYLALLSHSGSRGTGAMVCDRYSKLAMSLHPDLPKELKYLAWLDLNSQEGQEYWSAMNLMGEYASANHAVIHREVSRHLGARIIAGVENHHNFAWNETHEIDGRTEELIVHRKGATPAGEGVLGIIPGSMAAPGFVVEGLGSAASLNSASHGAGRVMSRTQAKRSFVWGNVRRELREAGVTVLSAGIDEVPGVYKDIHRVMACQRDLVRPVARFDPKLVKMAPDGEKAED